MDPSSLGPVRRVRTATLDVGYHDLGDRAAPAALLLHGDCALAARHRNRLN